MSAVPIELYKSIYNLLIQQGHEKSASALLKDAKLDKKSITKDTESLSDIYKFYKSNQKQVSKKSDSSDDDSDDDSDDSDDDPKPPAKKTVPETKTNISTVTKQPAAAAKKPADDDSSDDDSSDDSSEDEAPAKPTIALKAQPVAATATKAKAPSSSSDSDNSDSDDSDSDDSDDEEPAPVKKAQPVATKVVTAAPTKPVVKQITKDDSDDSDDSDDDDEEEEEEKPMPPAKRAKVEPPKAPAATSSSKKTASSGEVCRALVKGLPWLATEDEVSEFFVSCGTVTNVELPLTEEGRSSGTAIVSFGSRSEFDAAIALDGQIWPGTERWLKILDADKVNERKSFGGDSVPGERPEGCDTLFVGNLPWDIEEQQLWDLFGTVGEVSSVRFATSKEDGSFRGFGHVSFVNGDDTLEAVKLSGTPINGRALRLDFAPPKAARESFGGGGRGGASPGRGGRGGRDFGGGRGGRDGGRGGRGRGGPSAGGNKSKGSIAISTGSKKTFD